jgi:HK97 family phage major capsid protein
MIRDLLEKRAHITSEMRSLVNSPAGDGDLSAEQASAFDRLKADLDGVETSLRRAETLEAAEKRMAGQPVAGTGDARFDTEMRGFSLVRAIAGAAGIAGVDAGREKELSAELARRSGRAFTGIAVPLSVFHETRTLTTTLPAAGPGGTLIQTDVMGNAFIDRLRAALVTRRLGATVLSGLVGNVEIPALKASGSAGWVAENTAIPASDHQFRAVAMTPRHCGALTELSRNMLQQPSVDVENLVRADFAQILADAVDRAALKGSGVGAEPRGILNTPGVNTTVFAGAGLAKRAKVLEMIAEIQEANSEGTAFVTSPGVVKNFRSSPLPSIDSERFVMEEPNNLLGYSLTTTNNLSGVPGEMIFGKWSDLLLGYWSELDILVNPYEAAAYSKGNVQIRAMLTMDTAVRHAGSFSVATDID